MKPTPKVILVPTDFSPASDSALDLARELAGTFDAEIHLLHVCTIFDGPIVSPEDLDKVERVLATSDAKTKQALEASAQVIDAPTHCHVHRGAGPADAIIKAVTEHNCDLVIMGTNGRRGMKGLIVGSVAKEVVHRSPVPVLTTRAETACTFPPKKILVAYDSSEDSLQAVMLAADWAPLLSAEITLLHAMEPVTYPDFYAQYTPREDQMKRLGERCHNALVEVGSEHLSAVAHETAVIHAQAADGIADFATTQNFDLVILATRGLSGISHVLFGSVAERVTQLSKVPVLTVREPPQVPTGESTKKRKPRRFTTFPRRSRSTPEHDPKTSIERSQDRTILRFLERAPLAGADLSLGGQLWDFLEEEALEVADRMGTLPRATLVGLKRALTASNKDFRSYLELKLALAEQLAWTHGAE